MQAFSLRQSFIAFSLAATMLVGCSGAEQATEGGTTNPEKLVVALLPDENASSVIQDSKGLETYLEDRLGKDIELFVSTDYSSMIEAASNDRLDLAYFGPLSYVLAKTKSNIEPFAARVKDGSATYTAVIIGNAEQGIDSFDDIAGKTMAYGDQASTSSHLIPKSMLAGENLIAGKDYEEQFAGAHDAVAVAVQNGTAQAGGLSKPIFDTLVEEGVVDPKKVNIIAESEPFPEYPWTMRADLDPELKQQIRTAFYELEDEAVLEPLKAEGFVPIEDADYDGIRDLGKVLNLDFEALSK